MDWVARNLYWADSVNGQINAVGLDGNSTRTSDRVVILDRDLGQIRSLSLLPQKGFESAFIVLFLNIILKPWLLLMAWYHLSFSSQSDVLVRNGGWGSDRMCRNGRIRETSVDQWLSTMAGRSDRGLAAQQNLLDGWETQVHWIGRSGWRKY